MREGAEPTAPLMTRNCPCCFNAFSAKAATPPPAPPAGGAAVAVGADASAAPPATAATATTVSADADAEFMCMSCDPAEVAAALAKEPLSDVTPEDDPDSQFVARLEAFPAQCEQYTALLLHGVDNVRKMCARVCVRVRSAHAGVAHSRSRRAAHSRSTRLRPSPSRSRTLTR